MKFRNARSSNEFQGLHGNVPRYLPQKWPTGDMPCRILMKRKCRHFDEIFITGCTKSCQNDNFRCSQWWKFHQNDNISVSVTQTLIIRQAQYRQTFILVTYTLIAVLSATNLIRFFRHSLYGKSYFVISQPAHDVIITSLLRQDDVATYSWLICASRYRCEYKNGYIRHKGTPNGDI